MPALGAATTAPHADQLGTALMAAAWLWTGPATGSIASTFCGRWDGNRPPPDTLVERHCSLLL